MQHDNDYPRLLPLVCEVRSDPERRVDKPQKSKRWPTVIRFAIITALMAAAWFGVFTACIALGWSLGAAMVAASGWVFFTGTALEKQEEKK